MNSGGSNGVYDTQMFLVERTVLVNSAISTTQLYAAVKGNLGGLAPRRLFYWSLYRLLTVPILWRRYTWVTTEEQKQKSEER